jgi:hypothetical protein
VNRPLLIITLLTLAALWGLLVVDLLWRKRTSSGSVRNRTGSGQLATADDPCRPYSGVPWLMGGEVIMSICIIAIWSALATALLLIGLAVAALIIMAVWPVYVAGVLTVGVPWLAVWAWRRLTRGSW